MPDTGNEIVYHYCSLETFKNIIENECLWLCDVEKSNDSQERIYFEKIMLDQIDLYAEELKNKNNASKEHALCALQLIKEALQNHKAERAPVYSCCFSCSGDQLSQWRGYADDGYGVAIGFDSSIFQKYLPNETFRPVVYDPKDAKAQCKNILEQAVDHFSRLEESLHKSISMYQLYGEVLYSMGIDAIYFKSHFFYEENEYRLMTIDPSDDEESPSLYQIEGHPFIYSSPSVITPDNNQIFQLSEKKWRVSKRGLSAYYEFLFSNIKNDIIKSIILGPKCPAEKQDIIQFLKFNDYSDKINVKCSEGTYR